MEEQVVVNECLDEIVTMVITILEAQGQFQTTFGVVLHGRFKCLRQQLFLTIKIIRRALIN